MKSYRRGKIIIVRLMDFYGYHYDEIDSYDTWLVFNYELGRITFNSWDEVDQWLDNIIWEEGWK